MAIVRIYYHRNPARIGPHARYIATRDGACGLHGLGPEFRALRGDIPASVRLLEAHAAQARTRTGIGTREGPFVRLLFTLPTDVAARVSAADARLPEGSRLVLRDALEATFRSVGRQLQGVYAIHFHAAQREAHGHVHVDLSPLDRNGRTTFLTEQQQERLRSVWTREVDQALARVERRAASPRQETGAARDEAQATTATARRAAQPRSPQGRNVDTDAHRRAAPQRPRRQRTRYMPFVAARLFGWNRSPLADLFLRALMGRAERRWQPRGAPLAVRFALGLPVPRVTFQVRTPLIPRTLLRLPFTS